jgi:hypothetical protein
MTLDEVILQNRTFLHELEERLDLAKDAWSARESAKTDFEDKVESDRTRTTDNASEWRLTRDLPPTASPAEIQAIIDVVKRNIEMLEVCKDTKEMNKETATSVIAGLNELRQENEYFAKHFKELAEPARVFVYDATPHIDPLTAGLLISGVIAGVAGDMLKGAAERVADTVKDVVADTREAQADTKSLTREQLDGIRMIDTDANFERTTAFERDAEQRRTALDANIEKLTTVFEQRHQDTDPARRDELRAELQERFDQLREKLARELDAKFERMMNERDDRSR